MINEECMICDTISGKNPETATLEWTLIVPTVGKWKFLYGERESRLITDGAVMFRPSDIWEYESGERAVAYRCNIEPDDFSSVCDFLCIGAEETLWRSEKPFFVTDSTAVEGIKDSFFKWEQEKERAKKQCFLKMAVLKTLEQVLTEQAIAERDVFARFVAEASDPKNFDKSIPDFLGEESYCRDYFAKLFAQKYGCTPGAFIGEKKLEYAKKMLRESNASVREIAEKTGFSGENYFFRFFKKGTGKTPSEYRNNR